jgi:hypothetical protein
LSSPCQADRERLILNPINSVCLLVFEKLIHNLKN